MSQFRELGTNSASSEEEMSPRRQTTDGYTSSTFFHPLSHFSPQPSGASPEIVTRWQSPLHLGSVSLIASSEQEIPLDSQDMESWTNIERLPGYTNLGDRMHFNPRDFSIQSLEFRGRVEVTGPSIEFSGSHYSLPSPYNELEEPRTILELKQPQHPSNRPHSSSLLSLVSPNIAAPPDSRFPCLLQRYGCESLFGTKNDWKRHIATIHMKVDSWICKIPDCTSPNQERRHYRKDHLQQHIKRIHGNLCIDKIETCYERYREPPATAVCIHCSEDGITASTFTGPSAWDLNVDHIGDHLEKQIELRSEPFEDPYLKEWLMKHRMLTENDQGELVLGN